MVLYFEKERKKHQFYRQNLDAMVINAERCRQVVQKCAKQMNRYMSIIIDSTDTTFQHQWKTNHVNIKHLPLFLHIDKQKDNYKTMVFVYFIRSKCDPRNEEEKKKRKQQQ